jgi:hypothetical protein
MLEIKITSESKGSNPGGKCSLPYLGNQCADFYIKYCNSSRLPPQHPFNPVNQPIYEALTLVLAEKVGLHVPRYFVLMNKQGNIRFTQDHTISIKKELDENRPYYFVSRLVTLPREENLEKLKLMMEKEKVYRDLLMVGDVSGKKQNFALIDDPSPGHVLYIDLGCSFVDAVGGYLQQRNYITNLVRDVKGKQEGEPKRDLKQNLRHAERTLRKYALLTNHEVESSQDIIPLDELVESVREAQIPTLNPRGKLAVVNALSEKEIEEIINLLKMNMAETVKKYSDSGILVNLNSD